MMDGANIIFDSANEAGHENGVHEQLPSCDEECLYIEKANGIPNGITEIEVLNQNFEDIVQLSDNANIDSAIEKNTEGSTVPAESNGPFVSKELGAKQMNESKHSELEKDMRKGKNGKKPLGAKNAAGTSVKVRKIGKGHRTASAVSSTSLTSDSRAKQTFSLGIKSSSFNHPNNSKPTPTLNKAHSFKQIGKSDASTVHVEPSEGLTDKTKLKPANKVSSNNAEGSIQSSSSSMTGDAKPQRLGSLPTYNFSFKCNERAEKRREFYSKLEEKIQAKEVERSTIQAKTKESQEAEIKMLRKSLTFKATPMPSFYQEPAPPKTELKKIPTTRAKSPKLGRNKNAPTNSEGNNVHSFQATRLSLDEKKSQNNPTKGPSKRPIRMSVPKLPSQKTNLSNKSKGKNEPSSQQQTSLSNETNEPTQAIEPNQAEPNTNDGPVLEEQVQTTSVQEPISFHTQDEESQPNTNGGSVLEEQAQTTLVQGPIALV